MELNDNQKTAILVFSVTMLAYLFFVKEKIRLPGAAKAKANSESADDEDISDREPMKEPSINPQELKKSRMVLNAFNSLNAYIKAYNAGESQKDLDQMVVDLKKMYNVKIYKKPDGRMAVADGVGKDILINDL